MLKRGTPPFQEEDLREKVDLYSANRRLSRVKSGDGPVTLVHHGDLREVGRELPCVPSPSVDKFWRLCFEFEIQHQADFSLPTFGHTVPADPGLRGRLVNGQFGQCEGLERDDVIRTTAKSAVSLCK